MRINFSQIFNTLGNKINLLRQLGSRFNLCGCLSKIFDLSIKLIKIFKALIEHISAKVTIAVILLTELTNSSDTFLDRTAKLLSVLNKSEYIHYKSLSKRTNVVITLLGTTISDRLLLSGQSHLLIAQSTGSTLL